jgi:Uri superfamily endonuclease
VGHLGLDLVGLLVDDHYYSSSGHQWCTKGLSRHANLTKKKLRARIDYMKLSYEFTLLLTI